MSIDLSDRHPIVEINEPFQIVDFAARGDHPLILQTEIAQVLTFGTREESFGHQMVRFQFVKKGDGWPRDSEDELLFAYATPGLIFTENGRYLFFISPIAGVGAFDPSERKFAVMYPLVVVDLVRGRFAFANECMNSPFTTESVLKNLKLGDLKWHSGLRTAEIENAFRELHRQVDPEKSQTVSSQPSLLRRLIKTFFSDN